MKTIRSTLGLALLCLAGAAAAQKVTPGLWEYTATMKMQGAQVDAMAARMQEQLARMPPEKRQQMEAMMASRGISMGAGGPGAVMGGSQPVVVKSCVTAEQAARDEVAHHDGNCQQVSKERVGKTLKFKFVCTGEREAKGEGEYTFDSDKSMSGRVVVDSIVKGQASHMEMTHTARWLGADCGDIKPRGAVKR